jgi:hypothetical protein
MVRMRSQVPVEDFGELQSMGQSDEQGDIVDAFMDQTEGLGHGDPPRGDWGKPPSHRILGWGGKDVAFSATTIAIPLSIVPRTGSYQPEKPGKQGKLDFWNTPGSTGVCKNLGPSAAGTLENKATLGPEKGRKSS